MKAHCIDLTDKIAETQKWVTNYIENRDGMPSLAPLPIPNEDKLDVIMMHLKNLQKEGSGKEDKGRQGEDKGKQGNTNNTPQNSIPSQSPTQGHEYYAKPGSPPGLNNEPSGSGQPQGASNPIHVHPPVHPAKLTECFNIQSQGATPARDRTGDYEDTQHPGGIPRNYGEIHFNRNKEKGSEKFDGESARI